MREYGYSFRSQPHVCFCRATPCPHGAYTGVPTEHTVRPLAQQAADREQATNFYDAIQHGTPLASKGELGDATSGGEPLWLSLAGGPIQIAREKFTAAGGAGESGVRTIATNWAYVEVEWLVKIKVGSSGDVHYEKWAQPHRERTVLTKPKIVTVQVSLRTEELSNGTTRYILSAADYQLLLDGVRG
mmetsp:Transcript_7419/g.21906  ORF Transcript_7419/g.21906 Transcript_7419/m.21906 type:complete len:187 (+) Transcript_7419:2625-3185(+)